MTPNPPVWLYDGNCVLCSRAVTYVLDHGRNRDILFVALKSEQGLRLAEDHGVDPDDPDTFLFIKDGQAYAKSDGVFALASETGRWARLLLIGRLLSRPVCDALYDLVARNRYIWFGKRRSCRIPDPDQAHRFRLPRS